MSSSGSSLDKPFTSPTSLGAARAISEAPEPPQSPSHRDLSPGLTPLTSLSVTPIPPKRVVYVEVPTISQHIKQRYATDLSERVISPEEEYLQSEMQSIIGQYQGQSQLYYFVKVSEEKAIRVSLLVVIKLLYS